VYEYQSPLQDSVQHPPHYWYYRVVKGEDGKEAFVGVYYNHNFDIEQLVRERVVSNGVKTDDVRLYEYDDTGQRFDIQAEVKQNTTFFFEADETQILPYQLAWRSKSEHSGGLFRANLRERNSVAPNSDWTTSSKPTTTLKEVNNSNSPLLNSTLKVLVWFTQKKYCPMEWKLFMN